MVTFTMRLDKFIAGQSDMSRANAGRAIRAGRVLVDGVLVKEAAFKLRAEQQVVYDGQPLVHIMGFRYFMLYKPPGCVCSTDDPLHPTILHFICEPLPEKLHSAGRLDMDASGLVLLTDDGQWSHKVTSPRYCCEKVYRVTLVQPLAQADVARLCAGILLRNEKTLTKPARLEVIDECQVRITISEGRYHQVKRMFAAAGNHVLSLHRECIGEIVLDEALQPGDYRALTPQEIDSVAASRRVSGEN